MTDRHHVIEHARSTLPLTSLYNMSLLTCARHPSGNSARIPQSLSGLIRQLPYILKAGCIINLFVLFSGWVQCTTAERSHFFPKKTRTRSTHVTSISQGYVLQAILTANKVEYHSWNKWDHWKISTQTLLPDFIVAHINLTFIFAAGTQWNSCQQGEKQAHCEYVTSLWLAILTKT